jgi:tetratricopeptide (TPR) repeat protein
VIREKVLRPEHPDVATTLNNLVGFYAEQGKYGEAEPLYKRSLVIFEKTLGAEHTSVAIVLENLAKLLHRMKREDEAAKLEAHAKSIRTKRAW